jgi:predicted phage terminase large subunit-like protein
LNRPDVHVTRGSTFENAAHLAPTYLATMTQRYSQTPLGLQELYGEVVDTASHALWPASVLNQIHWPASTPVPSFERLVVAVDPAVTNHDDSDETGIVVMGRTRDGKGVVLDDLSGRFAPLEWAERAIAAYHSYAADCLVAEVNQGGDLVEKLIESLDKAVCYKPVRATRGKSIRAEPVAALYARGKIFHTRPFPDLERQLRDFPHATASSPDRLDALVWGLTELFLRPISQIPPLPKVWDLGI